VAGTISLLNKIDKTEAAMIKSGNMFPIKPMLAVSAGSSPEKAGFSNLR
jgi:hypothetical protein